MNSLRDIHIQLSLSPKMGRGMGVLFAEHLTEHILQFGLFVGRKRSNFFLQPTLVNCSYLIRDNLTVALGNLAFHAEGITVDGRRDGNDDCQSSTLSSSNISAATIWSAPSLCAFRAAADHPSLTVVFVAGTSVNTILRMSRSAVSAFCMATSLSKMGLSSRNSSARSCIAVIIFCVLVSRRKGTNNLRINKTNKK